jgi:uncharacterized membrane protein YhaH (DUF805 family)
MSDLHQPPHDPGHQEWPSEQPGPSRFANPYAPTQTYQGTAKEPVPLWAPLYGASLPEAVSRFFKKYATFSGRASRSEYWKWVIVSAGSGIALTIIMMIAGAPGAKVAANGATIPGPGYWVVFFLDMILSLAVLVPSLALSVRRLHDTNKSGWTYLLILIPLIGPVLMLVFMSMESNPEGQRFDVPKP